MHVGFPDPTSQKNNYSVSHLDDVMVVYVTFHNGEILLSRGVWGGREVRCIIVPNFIKIGQTVFEISRFFNFSKWRPSTILDIQNAEILLSGASRGSRRIILPNVVKIG